MTENLVKNWSFLKLLLDTNVKQRNALINSITKEQVKVLAEFMYNLSLVPLTDEEEHSIRRHRKFVAALSNLKRSHSFRLQTIRKSRIKLYKLLDSLKSRVQTLLAEVFNGRATTELK